MLILISLATFASTLLGGLFALRIRDRLHLVLGFSAGAVIAVAFFDLIPESLELIGESLPISTTMAIIIAGFAAYMVLDRFFFLHSHSGDHDHDESSTEASQIREIAASNPRGKLGAGSLSIHSLLDGVAIGLAFQVSATVGAIVTAAVLVHDFSDGINTVNLILKNNGTRKQAFKWLLVDSLAPVIGIILTLFFTVPESVLGIILAVFSGFFLYIGASDMLPESHHSHPRALTTVMTILGIVVLYTAIRIAGI